MNKEQTKEYETVLRNGLKLRKKLVAQGDSQLVRFLDLCIETHKTIVKHPVVTKNPKTFKEGISILKGFSRRHGC